MVSLKLKDKSVIVTGAASGIGREIALTLSNEGANIIAVDRDEHAVKKTCSLAAEAQALPLVVDLLDDKAGGEIVDNTVASFGGVDTLVNCAGIYPTAPALELHVEEWDSVLGLNVRAPFLCSQAVARHMVGAGRAGSIINIASTAGSVARPHIAHYGASKAALMMLTKVLAIEWAEHGIRVNAVAPGLVETPSVDEVLDTEEGYQEHIEKIKKIPLARTGEPSEIAEAVLFLAADNSSFVTGHTLVVDGGYSAGHTFRG